ncbi:hypothetical protein PgNI_06038 [Pyricularia grisea]|uniref:Uncharacterized protein n=1 Tax=Pyricularia grisea TaxID=148305 RepID=A0A6P8B7A3_PYRGI|nr:hypothetical protein PgNI_06038 [Pyricularia grisea]TLD11009.1 hypothetical protein PgNI_06038 [Pyricularia grisea]
MEDNKIVSVLYLFALSSSVLALQARHAGVGKYLPEKGKGQANDASMGWFNNIGKPPGPRSDATMSLYLGF